MGVADPWAWRILLDDRDGTRKHPSPAPRRARPLGPDLGSTRPLPEDATDADSAVNVVEGMARWATASTSTGAAASTAASAWTSVRSRRST